MKLTGNHLQLISLISITLLTASCSSIRVSDNTQYKNSYLNLSIEDKQLADTLIKKVLDNEGIYTVISGLKPMSSVTELYLEIAAEDTLLRGKAKVTDTNSKDINKLNRYQRILNTLKFGDLRFMISPYRANQKKQRVMQISVHRKSLIDSLLHADQSFFGQFGLIPGTSPEILVNTIEYEDKYNRFRGYGYLFGYPEHAVTFFTDASISESKTGLFVKRDFLEIPVFSPGKGHFVYAVPKEYKGNQIDSNILKRAKYYLLQYRALRKKYQRRNGSVRYYDLLVRLNR